MSDTPAMASPAPAPAAPSAPSIPIPTDTTIVKDITWIRTHILICLLAIVVIAGGIFGGVSLVENLIERHDTRVATAQQKAEGVDTATQAALMAQLAQYRTVDASRDATQTALIATLISKMNQQHVVTDQQVKTDATLDSDSAAARLAAQTKASAGEVATSNGSVVISLPVTRTIVASLDQLPQAQSDVVNLQGQLNAQQILTTDAKTELGTANQVITADKVELIATIKGDNDACNVRVDAQAKKDRKRGFWATLAGIAGGIVIGSRF